MPDTLANDLPPQDALHAWVAACLAEPLRLPDVGLPMQAAADQGVLPWLGWRLQESGLLAELPAGQQEELRDALRRWGLMHLDCDAELERLAATASERGLRFIAFKGHSVARTLYPHPACRPTSDFDLLLDPAQIAAARDWIAAMGYTPLQAFVGNLWLGAQSWASDDAGNARFHADLHWDYSNRMYFRNRVPFESLWARSRAVPCGAAALRLPCPVDDLVLACVHLAAHDPGRPVLLRWLLDIRLLLGALGADDIRLLLRHAGRARAVEACLAFGEAAAALDHAAQLEPVLGALRGAASQRRRRAYRRTMKWRAWDLGAYWLRLPFGDKLAFFGDMRRWIRVR
jgi:hypothetical protein